METDRRQSSAKLDFDASENLSLGEEGSHSSLVGKPTMSESNKRLLVLVSSQPFWDRARIKKQDRLQEILKQKEIEFELVDGVGTIYSSWKVLDQDNRIAGLVIENPKGQQIRMTADKINFLQGRTNPVVHLTLDDQGVQHGSGQEQQSNGAQ